MRYGFRLTAIRRLVSCRGEAPLHTIKAILGRRDAKRMWEYRTGHPPGIKPVYPQWPATKREWRGWRAMKYGED